MTAHQLEGKTKGQPLPNTLISKYVQPETARWCLKGGESPMIRNGLEGSKEQQEYQRRVLMNREVNFTQTRQSTELSYLCHWEKERYQRTSGQNWMKQIIRQIKYLPSLHSDMLRPSVTEGPAKPVQGMQPTPLCTQPEESSLKQLHLNHPKQMCV